MPCGNANGDTAVIDLSRRDSMLAMLAATTPVAASGQASVSAATLRSVMDFGATGDGQTDDTDAFVRALSSSGYVFIPPAARAYRITRTLAMRQPGQRMIGCGALSKIMFGNENANLIVTEHDDCTFSDLHLVPASTSPNLYEGWAIAISNARRAIVRNCLFSGLRRGGILVADSDDCRIEANIFVDALVRGDGRERQAETGYDIFVAGTASRNLVTGNQCLSGVGTGIGCQTVTLGKSQYGNVIRANMIRNQPAYGIMVYLSDINDRAEPVSRIDAITIEGNDIADISGSIRTEGGTIFYGCGIYLQTTNDAIVCGNRIANTNTDRRLPFSGSAVPAAIGISGYGNAVVTGNIIDKCHHGIASIQTTARPRRGDATLIANNLVRNCDGAGLWLGDCAAATAHDNHLTAAKGAGTHGILIRRFASRWMGGYSIRGNVVTDFTVGIEVAGEGIERAEIASNDIKGNRGNGIYTAARLSLVHHNQIEGQFGISINPAARTGSCHDNVLLTRDAAIIDDGGSGIRVEDNIMPSGARVPGGYPTRLAAGPAPLVTAKRWYAKHEPSAIERIQGGYEGQTIVIVAHVAFVVRHGDATILFGGTDLCVEPGCVIALACLDGKWRQT